LNFCKAAPKSGISTLTTRTSSLEQMKASGDALIRPKAATQTSRTALTTPNICRFTNETQMVYGPYCGLWVWRRGTDCWQWYYDNLSNDSSSERHFIEPTVYRKRQFLEPAAYQTKVLWTRVHRKTD